MKVRGSFGNTSQCWCFERARQRIGVRIGSFVFRRGVRECLSAPEVRHRFIETNTYVVEQRIGKQRRQVAERAIRFVAVAENDKALSGVLRYRGFIALLGFIPG